MFQGFVQDFFKGNIKEASTVLINQNLFHLYKVFRIYNQSAIGTTATKL